jgi:hypothetical protein
VIPLPFDRVAIAEDEGRREYTAADFLALPIHRRITWLLESRISFFLRSRPVDKRDALLALRRYEQELLSRKRKP